MTKEQEKKAKIALLRHDNMERLKALKLSEHERATALVSAVGLPYKVIKANLNTWRLAPDSAFLLPVACPEKVEISPFYPQKKPCLSDFRDWLQERFPDVFAEVSQTFSSWFEFLHGSPQSYIDLSEVQGERAKVYYTEFLEEKQGFHDDSERDYCFAHFLHDADIDHLTAFELFGSKDHSEEETMAFKAELKALQTAYTENPQGFYNPPIEQHEPPADDLSGIDAASPADGISG